MTYKQKQHTTSIVDAATGKALKLISQSQQI